MKATTYGIVLNGLDPTVVRIDALAETPTEAGNGVGIEGLTDGFRREARARVQCAVKATLEKDRHALASVSPLPTVHVSLTPALPRGGASLDLAIAVAVLRALASPRRDSATMDDDTVYLAELGLDGRLLPTRGVLPMLRHEHGRRTPDGVFLVGTTVVAPNNAGEAADGAFPAVACNTLHDVCAGIAAPARRAPYAPDTLLRVADTTAGTASVMTARDFLRVNKDAPHAMLDEVRALVPGATCVVGGGAVPLYCVSLDDPFADVKGLDEAKADLRSAVASGERVLLVGCAGRGPHAPSCRRARAREANRAAHADRTLRQPSRGQVLENARRAPRSAHDESHAPPIGTPRRRPRVRQPARQGRRGE